MTMATTPIRAHDAGRITFAALPAHLRAEIASAWGVLDSEAGAYFDVTSTAWRWEVITAFLVTSPTAALQLYLAQADASTLRDLGHLLLARSRLLESVSAPRIYELPENVEAA